MIQVTNTNGRQNPLPPSQTPPKKNWNGKDIFKLNLSFDEIGSELIQLTKKIVAAAAFFFGAAIISKNLSGTRVGGVVLGLAIILGGIAMNGRKLPLTGDKKDQLPDGVLDITRELKTKPDQFLPVIGRAKEMESLVTILESKRNNNAMLTGPAGCGKTALVEELARKMIAKDPSIPKKYHDFKVYSVSIYNLFAGANTYGEWYKRISHLIEYIQSKKEDSIFFIDEIHMLFSSENDLNKKGNFGDMLKPILGSGCHVIGATTEKEYKRDIAPQDAIDRRFQKLALKPLTQEETISTLQQLNNEYFAKPYNIIISEENLNTIVKKSSELKGNFPAKAIDLLDRVCCTTSRRLATSSSEQPREIVEQDIEKALEFYEQKEGSSEEPNLQELQNQLKKLKESLGKIN